MTTKTFASVCNMYSHGKYKFAGNMDECTKQAGVKEQVLCLCEAFHVVQQLAPFETRNTLINCYHRMHGAQAILFVGHKRTLYDDCVNHRLWSTIVIKIAEVGHVD